MSIAIGGKLLGGFIVSSSGVAAIAYMVMSSIPYMPLSEKESENIYIYAISQEITDVSNTIQPTEDIKTGNNEKNYQCKFNNKYYGCEISASEAFDTQTKQWNIDKFKTAVVTGATTITTEALKTKDNIYKIKINKDIGDWAKETEKFSIDIIPNTEKDKTKKYASLKPLFAINSDGVTINKYTKTKYFVVKNTTTTVGSSSTTVVTNKCLTSATEITSNATVDTECNVYVFSNEADNDKTLDSIKFTKTTTESDINSQTTNKHYLVKLRTPVKTNEVQHIKIKPSTGDEVSLKSEIIPAIFVKEDDTNIFILKKADVTDQQTSGKVGS